MKTTKEQIEVMQAYVDGKTIKQTGLRSNEYVGVFDRDNSPITLYFIWEDYDYDIVEKPIVKYVIVTRDDIAFSIYSSYANAVENLKDLPSYYRIVKLVQDVDFKGDEE